MVNEEIEEMIYQRQHRRIASQGEGDGYEVDEDGFRKVLAG